MLGLLRHTGNIHVGMIRSSSLNFVGVLLMALEMN